MDPHGRVLLVMGYDERAMYGEFLRHHRLLVDDFERPDDALASFHTHAPPDVVVADFVFIGGDMDGPSAVGALRNRVDEATSIVVLSGLARREDAERARVAGADRFLIKPILPRDVLREVRGALVTRWDNRRVDWSFVHSSSPTVERRRSVSAAQRARASGGTHTQRNVPGGRR
jgi:CheY-like chemotaxis protein